jgi:hypothetical protein
MSGSFWSFIVVFASDVWALLKERLAADRLNVYLFGLAREVSSNRREPAEQTQSK